jgi:hypothetical protein
LRASTGVRKYFVLLFLIFCVLRAALALAKKIFGPKYKSMTLEV